MVLQLILLHLETPWGHGSQDTKFPNQNSNGEFTLTIDELDKYFQTYFCMKLQIQLRFSLFIKISMINCVLYTKLSPGIITYLSIRSFIRENRVKWLTPTPTLYPKKVYDVIIIAGHAGCEAVLASARLGCSTLVVTINLIPLPGCHVTLLLWPKQGNLLEKLILAAGNGSNWWNPSVNRMPNSSLCPPNSRSNATRNVTVLSWRNGWWNSDGWRLIIVARHCR